jgi:hypothetical protein
MFNEQELARRGGGSVTLCMDEFQFVGSRNAILPALSELHGLGLIDWQRFPKRHVVALRDIETTKQATIVSAVARTQRMPLLSHERCAASQRRPMAA